MKIRKQAFLLILLIVPAVLLITSHSIGGLPEMNVPVWCGRNMATASAFISISGDMVEGENYIGVGLVAVTCAWKTDSDTGPISITCVRKRFLGWSWLSKKVVSVNASAYITGHGAFWFGNSSANASGSVDGAMDADKCVAP